MPRHTGAACAALLFACLLALWGCKEQTAPTPSDPAPGATPQSVSAAFDKPARPEGPVSIQIVTNGVSQFWTAMAKGMEEMRAELGCKATWVGPQPDDHATQKQEFERALASGVHGIAVSPIQADAFAPVIDAAIDSGIPVITFDSDSETSKRLAYIGTNNYEAGKRAGEEAVKLFPNGGNLVAFVGNMGAQNARDRYRGFVDAVKGHGITMLQEPFEDEKDQAAANRNVADAITRYGGKLNGLLGLYSYNGPAIINGVRQARARDRLKVLCFDGEPATLEGLQNGSVDFTVVQKPYEFGRLTTRLLYLINRVGYTAAMEQMRPDLEAAGMSVKDNIIDTGVEVVTPANAAEFSARMKARGLTAT